MYAQTNTGTRFITQTLASAAKAAGSNSRTTLAVFAICAVDPASGRNGKRRNTRTNNYACDLRSAGQRSWGR